MKRFPFFPRIFFLSIVLTLSYSSCLAQKLERPKLIVGIVVDQMRWDYLYRYYDLYGEGGFRRLINEGYNLENTMINYLPSVTSIGHTSIYTGSVPAIHGITGNTFFMDGKSIYCCEDSIVKTIGSNTQAGKMSPRNMLSTTIGDELKISTDFKSKVIGVALKDRAAILPAGHAANGAFWFDFTESKFITSSYYMQELPSWLEDYNKTIGKVDKDEVSYSFVGNKLTIELAKEAIKGERLGKDGLCDMLTISFSCPDLIGHKYATHHEKTRDIYVDLDSRLEDFFNFLDSTYGKEEYLVFLTADHGGANNILMLNEHNIPSQGFFVTKILDELNLYLKKEFSSQENLLLGIKNYRIYLNKKTIKAQNLNINKVKKSCIKYLEKDPQFEFVVDLEHVSETTIPSIIKEKIINGYHRLRSGDIQLILNPASYEVYGEEIDEGTTHGQWNPYDAHIPFILMGWHIEKGTSTMPTYITDIAPTICSLVHIQMPNSCIGNSVFK